MQKNSVAFVISGLLSVRSFGQMVMGAGSIFTASNMELAANCSIINKSNSTDLSGTQLFLTGTDQDLSTSSPLTLEQLTVSGGGDKRFRGVWRITNQLNLNQGWVVPALDNGTKITFSGSLQPVGHAQSYVKGIFFSKGKGNRNFPIGNTTGYHPAVLTELNNFEAGLEVIDDNPAIQLGRDAKQLILPDRYWKLSVPDNNFSGSIIGLSFANTSITSSPAELVIIGADHAGANGIHLGASSNDTQYIYSQEPVIPAESIYTLATRDEQEIKIHNLITPNDDNQNNGLYIESIEKYPVNKVLLADRWGLPVKEWQNFNNSDPQGFSFGSLGAGNYICSVAYSSPAGQRKVSQMITVIK